MTDTMSVDAASVQGAPHNLVKLARVAAESGYGVTVARTSPVDGWVLTVSGRCMGADGTGRYVWEGSRWSRDNTHGFRFVCEWLRANRADAAPDAPAERCAQPVVSSATGETTGAACGGALSLVGGTLTCGRCGMFTHRGEDAAPVDAAPDAPADRDGAAVAAGRVTVDAGKEAQTHLSAVRDLRARAESLKDAAEGWAGRATDAGTTSDAEECAAECAEVSAEIGHASRGAGDSGGKRAASGLVKDAAALLRKIKKARKAIADVSGVVAGDAGMEALFDHWHGATVSAEADAREALGEIEDAADAAEEAAEDAADYPVCPMCECMLRGEPRYWSCGCRAVLAAHLADSGSVHQQADDVRAGRWLASDDDTLRQAGELAVAGAWLAAEAKAAEAIGAQRDALFVLPGAEDAAAAEAECARRTAKAAARHAERIAARRAAVPGPAVRTVRGDGRPVDVQWAGYGERCAAHCPDECPGWVHDEDCECAPRPVVLVDGPAEPFDWQDCAECAAETLGVPAGVILAAADSRSDGGPVDAPVTPASSGKLDASTSLGDIVSDPGAVDAWESEGGACPGVDVPGPEEGSAPAAPVPGPRPASPAAEESPKNRKLDADASLTDGIDWQPRPDGERWDFAHVRAALARWGMPEGEFGECDGWQVNPDTDPRGVMITRVQGRAAFRPRSVPARERWDAALATYRQAAEGAGFEVIRRNAHCAVVAVPVPEELWCTARARRIGEPDDFTTAVTFDGFEGIGGTVQLHSAGAGASTFTVRDHTGRTIHATQRDRRAATASLAHWYGLPTPADYVEERQEQPQAPQDAPEVRQARRRIAEAAQRAQMARENVERAEGAAAGHYGRFQGGQPILMGHHSARGALQDRARGDAATRRAIAAREDVKRAEADERGARIDLEIAETVHGRARSWERSDFQRGDVVEIRKRRHLTIAYVVVRANAKTLTLRNRHTIDDARARYDQVLARVRDGHRVTDPAETDGGHDAAEPPAAAPRAGKGGFSGELDAATSQRRAVDVASDPGAVDTWESEGGACRGVDTPRGPEEGPAPAADPGPAPTPGGTGGTLPGGRHPDDEEGQAPAAVQAHPALDECRTVAELLADFAAAHPDDEEAQRWAEDAAERLDVCGWHLDEDDEEGARALAEEARRERAAFLVGRIDDAGPMTPERLAALDADTLALFRWFAGPWPVRWLFAPETGADGRSVCPRVVNLFHGPGGWSVGIRDVLGADVDMVGVDLDPGAVATATAAGFEVIHASVTDLDPESPALRWVSGVILSPPCQAYSPAGLRKGRYADAIALIVSVIVCAGAAAGFFAVVDDDGNDAGYAPRLGESWDEVREPLAELEDPRAGLMAEVVIWPLAMLARGGSVEWVAVEQSSALPAEIERALFAEFTQAGWGTVEAETLDAVDYGAASHRRRRFMTAYRHAAPFVPVRPAEPFPVTTFAQCVGWQSGRLVNTRGRRGINSETGRPKGGGTFNADRPSSCVTATAYGWRDEETGERIGQAAIGRLVGFVDAYPWRHIGRGEGIRTRAQQAADAVCPMVAAAVVGRALDVEEWEARTRAYVNVLYRLDKVTAAPVLAPALAVGSPRPQPVRVAALVPAPPTGPAYAGQAEPVAVPLSRLPQTGASRGVRAGHSTRQVATRQLTRQHARQLSNTPGRRSSAAGGRGPPRGPAGPPAGCRTPRILTGSHQVRDSGRRLSPPCGTVPT